MSGNINNTDSRNELINRLDKLKPDMPPLWGKMTSEQMLSHLNDAFRCAMGMKSLQTNGYPSWLQYPARLIFVHWIKWPKGLPAPPEFQADRGGSSPRDLETERAFLKTMLDVFCERPEDKFTPHPVFGKMNKKDYGKMLYKHSDHHLRQFGV